MLKKSAILVSLMLLLLVLNSCAPTADTTVTESAPAENTATENLDTFETSPPAQEEETPSPDISDSLTMGQKNALGQANSYLSLMHFSRSGLIDQLEFEGYTTEDATFAVDNCGADWNEQAAGKAVDYLNTSAFSYSGLVDQLEFEGFSTEEATYGVDACGADWNEQAALKAQSYLDIMSFSRSQLIDQLEFEGFTAEQAEYGATAAGY